jgi:hypothetical protein
MLAAKESGQLQGLAGMRRVLSDPAAVPYFRDFTKERSVVVMMRMRRRR